MGYLYSMWKCVAVTSVIKSWNAKSYAGGIGGTSRERERGEIGDESKHERCQETQKKLGGQYVTEHRLTEIGNLSYKSWWDKPKLRTSFHN